MTTKRERLRELEDLVLELAPCKSLRTKHPAMFEFFVSLFHKHPKAVEKRVADIKDISLEPKSEKRSLDADGGPVFRIHYSCRKSDTISWRKCVD